MPMSNEYITIEDFIKANRSPLLQPAEINYRSNETPPPVININLTDDGHVDIPQTDDSNLQPRISRKFAGLPQPSLCDSLLIKLLGPDYPEVASEAAKSFLTLSPESPWKDRKPEEALRTEQMVYDRLGYASPTKAEARFLAVAAFEASQKLNAAIEKDRRSDFAPAAAERLSTFQRHREGSGSRAHMALLVDNGNHSPIDHRHYVSTSESSLYQTPKPFNVKPPPRTCLPPIKTNSPIDHSPVISSATFAKFSIAPIEDNSEQQLPRMHTSPRTGSSRGSPSSRQTLPSLKTTLSTLSTPIDSTYPGPSSAQHPHFGPSPSLYSNPPLTSAISPPRLPTAPSYWRTISRETSNSTPSDNASVPPSVGISTPASSAPALSPTGSAHTPATIIHDCDAHLNRRSTPPGSVSSMQPDIDGTYSGSYCGGSFKCTWPGCNALPFQTQYLLNSHANVHSNTRPHFCPVQGCPRGPGGQGFKRKNEMIRHGLVHQSPGYVCPFCPDQQHKYPRPDNLQRHVRVHHVDRNRDDPLLRDVLAQRPEGGNRGRRRRLGS